MLNRIAASTRTFIPISMLLLDMLEMKELNRTPTGGAGKAIDMRIVLKVDKSVVKTRSFQEACVYSVIEELGEHLSQWSYSVAFFELSFIPAARLRNFCKSTKVERFRKETTRLIRQIEANSKFTNARRASISFLPNDPAASSFLEDEKTGGASPLSQYVKDLQERSRQRNEALVESSAVVGEHASVFGGRLPESDEEDDGRDEEGAAVFSSDWLPGSDSKSQKNATQGPKKAKKKKKQKKQEETAFDEDVVEDLVISSDEDEDGEGDELSNDRPAREDTEDDRSVPVNRQHKKRKTTSRPSKGKSKARNRKSKKLKLTN
uniref:Nucleolar complex protein 2 n=1 Tax=Kalanchoe fedtschenkoi TaxID=63787 RepID=A0A7N0UF79_KALFE